MRLTVLIIVTWTTLLALGCFGYLGTKFQNNKVDEVYFGGVNKLEQLIRIKNNLGWVIISNLEKARNELLKPEEALNLIQQTRTKSLEEWNDYLSKDPYLTNNLLNQRNAKVEQINQLLKNSDDFFRKVKDALQQNDKEQITSILKNDVYPIFEPIAETLQQIIQLHMNNVDQDFIEAKDQSQKFGLLMVISLLISLSIYTIFSYVIVRSIVQPLKYVVQNVDRMAEGDTSMNIHLEAGGELGQLLKSISNMNVSTEKMSSILAEYASGDLSNKASPRSDRDILGISLNEMSSQMRTMIGEIKNEVNVLTSSSHEIMASLSQLSSGTAESATAVTETTATLEELKQTAHVSSEKAKEVLASAEETLQTVDASAKSVQSVIEDMNQIRDRMQIISESILKLSEKSLLIAEIMNSVNEIAEQSNLLAVNAAIEAAKAGEQGRSFSVVAQEIRTLAEQSKGATVQVRSLLNEIQGATNSAVMATEQGSKAVAKGVEQSNQTTKAIKNLTGNMTQVTQSANQIVLSNQQQSIGTEQISIAMSNINEATQQHVEKLKKIEDAVSALSKVSTSLKGLTDQYKLNNLDGEERKELIKRK